jgi:hypothetical protein
MNLLPHKAFDMASDFQSEALHKFDELHGILELKKIGCTLQVQTNAKPLQSNTTSGSAK